MTFIQMVQELVRLAGMAGVGGPPVISGQTGEYKRAIEFIRLAHQDVCNLHLDWDFLWATDTLALEAGTATYAGPADLGAWDGQRLFIDNEPLPLIDWPDYQPETLSPARPHSAALRPDGQLLMLPAPDGDYTLAFEYWKQPPDLTDDADEPLIPAQFRRVIVGRALMLYGNYEAAEDAKMQGAELYRSYLELLERHQLSRRQQTYGRTNAAPIVVTPQ
ncbi:hypothetical protein ACGTNG_12540 [Halomonas sp. 1390]|uniref:phage adaptor protein n=1 Tax=Halomonas sp. B23F22_3 TaxID=3459516 RepID=UPI00373EE921